MSAAIRKSFIVMLATVAMLSAKNTFADDERFYESLPEVAIGKVFFSPQQRARLEQRRGSAPAVAGGGVAPPGGARRKNNDDAAGFILSSKGTSKVYADGDFVSAQRSVAVEFPGSVKIVRSADPDEAEASDEAD